MCNVSLCSRSAFLLYFHTSDVSCKDHFICCFLILHGVRPSSTAPSPPTWPSPRHRRSLASGPTAGPTPSTASASRLRATWRRWERRSSDPQETDFDKSARALSETWSCCWVVSLASVILVRREVCWVQGGGAVSQGEVSGEDGAHQHSLSGTDHHLLDLSVKQWAPSDEPLEDETNR